MEKNVLRIHSLSSNGLVLSWGGGSSVSSSNGLLALLSELNGLLELSFLLISISTSPCAMERDCDILL